MIELKAGVRLHGIRPEVVLGIHAAEGIWLKAGAPTLVITAGIEGTHTEASSHYCGRAVDLRTKNLPPGQSNIVIVQLKTALGVDYFVLLENAGEANEHCHLEWRPGGAYTP